MKQIIANYSFNTSTKAITLTDFGTVRLDRLQLIVDTTTNKILYNFADSSIATATISSNAITLSALQGGESNTDKLQIIYNTLTADPTYDTQPASGTIAAGAADSGNPVKVGGVYNSTQPTYTNGQRGDVQISSRGAMVVAPRSGSAQSSGGSDGANNSINTLFDDLGNSLLRSVRPSFFNNSTWDRQRNDYETTTGDTGAKTATFNGAAQTNYNARGAKILFNIGTVSGTSPTLVAKLQGSNDGGTTWYDIPGAATATITATGQTLLEVYPGVTPSANAAVECSTPSHVACRLHHRRHDTELHNHQRTGGVHPVDQGNARSSSLARRSHLRRRTRLNEPCDERSQRLPGRVSKSGNRVLHSSSL